MGIRFEDMLAYYTWIDLLMSRICIISSYSEVTLPILFGNESPLSGVRGLPMVMVLGQIVLKGKPTGEEILSCSYDAA